MRHARFAVLAVVAAGALAALAVTVDHAGDEVYGLPAWAVAAAVVAAAAAVAGSVLLWRSGAPGTGLAALVVALLAVAGVLAILSFGILLLGVAAAAGVWVGTRTRKGRRHGWALGGGALAGAALPLLALTALSPPLVDCASGRAGENFFLGLTSSSSSSSGVLQAGGDARGRMSGEGYEFSYECRGDRLVRFEFHDR